jgi:hypothetical protein
MEKGKLRIGQRCLRVCKFKRWNRIDWLGERKSQKCLGDLVREINCVDEGVADPD